MSLIVWDEKLNTGVDVIDHQHRRIVDYINELHRAIEEGDKSRVGEVLEDMSDYTIAHFAFEESLQEKCEYGAIEEHKALHDAFAGKITGYQKRHNTGEDIAGSLLSDLQHWLTHHITQEDADYIPVVRQKYPKDWVSRMVKRFFH
jgi:hemerythrin